MTLHCGLRVRTARRDLSAARDAELAHAARRVQTGQGAARHRAGPRERARDASRSLRRARRSRSRGGGRLEATTDSLRIRERKESAAATRTRPSDRSVYVARPAMATSKRQREFPDQHLDVGGEVRGAAQGRDLRAACRRSSSCTRASASRRGDARHGLRDPARGERTKFWDNKRYRSLPVTNFSVILPISVPEAPEVTAFEEDRALVETLSSNDQVAELADEFAVFQGETKNALTAVVVGRRGDRRAAALHQSRADHQVIADGGCAAMNALDFRSRTAVITGGAAGIGLAVAQRSRRAARPSPLWDRDARGARDSDSGAIRRHADVRARRCRRRRGRARRRRDVRDRWGGSTCSCARPASPVRTCRRGSIRSTRGAR